MSDTTELLVPDIGDFDDVEIIEVLVAVGDTVAVEDSLVTLETDKATMEVPATTGGTVTELLVKVGDRVSKGSPLLKLATQESETTTADIAPEQTESEKPQESVPTTASAPAQPASSAETQPETAPPSPAPEITSPPKSGPPPVPQAISPTQHLSDDSVRKPYASPAVRRFARELGADLALVSGTGQKNRILKSDVQEFIKAALSSSGTSYGGSTQGVPAAGSGIPPVPEIDFSKFGPFERIDLGRINKLSASNLHRAWLNVPHVTHHDEADITDLEAFRKSLKSEAEKKGIRVTGLVFHMKALAHMLGEFPKFNSSLSVEGDALIYKQYCHIGIAVDTPNGLVVPVFRDVDKKSIYELSQELMDVSVRAREKKLKPDEMQGACMTISSLGGIGGTAFTPIVNTPEAAILGISRAKMQPVWNGSEFIPRLMCPLDISYDHRIIDGADAARFMASYCQTIADIRRVLL